MFGFSPTDLQFRKTTFLNRRNLHRPTGPGYQTYAAVYLGPKMAFQQQNAQAISQQVAALAGRGLVVSNRQTPQPPSPPRQGAPGRDGSPPRGPRPSRAVPVHKRPARGRPPAVRVSPPPAVRVSPPKRPARGSPPAVRVSPPPSPPRARPRRVLSGPPRRFAPLTQRGVPLQRGALLRRGVPLHCPGGPVVGWQACSPDQRSEFDRRSRDLAEPATACSAANTQETQISTGQPPFFTTRQPTTSGQPTLCHQGAAHHRSALCSTSSGSGTS